MARYCESCNYLVATDSNICPECRKLRNQQNRYYGVELTRPISNCIMNGCRAKATKNGVCYSHTKSHLLTGDSSVARETINLLTSGRLDELLEDFSIYNQEIIEHQKIDRLAVEEVMSEGCEVNPLIPQYLADSPRFKSPEKGYCKSEHNCFNEVFKDGLCKTHYYMREGKIPSYGTHSEYNVKEVNGLFAFAKTKLNSESRVCATPGCKKQAYLTKYCTSCIQKKSKHSGFSEKNRMAK